MLALELMNAIITELKTISEFGVRVYAAQSRVVTFPGEKPYAKVIFKGSEIIPQKPDSLPPFYKHRFAVYIDDIIWREQAAVVGIASGQVGTLHLLNDAINELKNERFTATSGLTGHIALASVTAIYGTEDYLQYGGAGASIGFEIEYMEV